MKHIGIFLVTETELQGLLDNDGIVVDQKYVDTTNEIRYTGTGIDSVEIDSIASNPFWKSSGEIRKLVANVFGDYEDDTIVTREHHAGFQINDTTDDQIIIEFDVVLDLVEKQDVRCTLEGVIPTSITTEPKIFKMESYFSALQTGIITQQVFDVYDIGSSISGTWEINSNNRPQFILQTTLANISNTSFVINLMRGRFYISDDKSCAPILDITTSSSLPSQ